MLITNYFLTQTDMEPLDSIDIAPYGEIVSQQLGSDTSSLAIIIILALVTGLLFLILFLLFSQNSEQKKIVLFIQKLSTEDFNKNQKETNGDKVKPYEQTDSDRTDIGEKPVSLNDMPELLRQALKEKAELVHEKKEMQAKIQSLRSDLERNESTDNDAGQFVSLFAQKQITLSKEGISHIVENGDQWLEEINALKIKNNDNQITFYVLMKTLVDMAKKMKREDDFINTVFNRYRSFIQNPGGLQVKDKKEDEILFLKISLELSILFRDLIRRILEPEQFQTGKPQNINFEMMMNGLLPSQITTPQYNRQFDGSNIPSNLLAYSLICNMNGIDDLNVFVSGDKIQKNIR